VIAALAVAIVQQLLAGYVSPDYIEAYPFMILLVALIFRPFGLIRETTRVRY
jgi:branched-subunit amino acid ABC-type transport system permease component